MSPATEWRFGAQSGLAERAEIERAKAEGRTDEYIAAQAAWAAWVAAGKPGVASERTASGTRTKSVRSPADAEPADLAYTDGLLADHRRGFLQPIPITIPVTVPGWAMPVAEFVALVVGLRGTVGDLRHPILSARWVARHVGCSKSLASRALRKLAEPAVGFLSRKASMDAPPGCRYGTAVYGVPGVTVEWRRDSDGVPDAQLERGAVPVETEHVGAAGAAVEPAGKAVDEPGVGDAVGRGHGLAGMLAAGDGAEVGAGHGSSRYARTPTAATLLRRAAGRPVPERDAAWWLACQLRDNGHDEHGAAFEAMADFAAAASARFTLADSLRTLRKAYATPKRPPWGPPGGAPPAPSGDEPDAASEPDTARAVRPKVTGPPVPDCLPGEYMRDWQDRTLLPGETTKNWARRRREHEATRAER